MTFLVISRRSLPYRMLLKDQKFSMLLEGEKLRSDPETVFNNIAKHYMQLKYESCTLPTNVR